jgi:hypothetical protein
MGMPSEIAIVDTMIGFPHEGFGQYDFIRKQTKDLPTSDPISVTLHEMDRFGVEIGLIGVSAGGDRRPEDVPGTTRRRSSTTPTHGAGTRSSTGATSRWD